MVWREQRRALLYWSASLSAITLFYMAFWPVMGAEMMAAIEGMPEALMRAFGYDRVGTAAGYMEAVIYALIGPALALIYAIGLGGRILAGQEEDGSLELDLAAPISRQRLYWERYAAGWLLLSLLVASATLAALVSGPLFDLNIASRLILATSFGLWLLTGGFFSIAFALGAISGRRAVGVGSAAGLATLAFVFRGVADAAGVELLATLSPLSWLLNHEPLVNGLPPVEALKLALLSLLSAPLGLLGFQGRDLLR
jgi:ABC-2 type transport system permease protein